MELRTVVQLLRDRWKSILVVTLLAALAATVLVARETPMYSAQATLYVSSRADPGNPLSAYQGSLLSQQQVSSFAELVRTSRVLDEVAASLHPPVTTAALAARISTTVVPDTALLVVTVLDDTAVGAQRLADAVANRFVVVLPTLGSGTTGTAGASAAITVSVVSAATVPTSPVSPRPLRSVGLGTLLGLLSGIALAAARHTLDLTVKSVEQAHEITKAPALGTVPVDPTAAQSPLVLREGVRPERAEALRKVSASLQFIDVERRHAVLLVTSPSPQEGKSSTACNLALTLARTGRRVILIDGDLRRPKVANYLGLPGGVGLTSVLVGRASLAEATQIWADNLFSVLTSGPIPPNPSEMLGSQRMRDLLARLRTEYDDIVVDAAPVLPVADAAVLAPACDGVILIARHGRTRRDLLAQAAATIRATGTPILGVVLNRAPVRRRADQYYAPQPESATARRTLARRTLVRRATALVGGDGVRR